MTRSQNYHISRGWYHETLTNTYTRLKGLGIEPVETQERILRQEEMQ